MKARDFSSIDFFNELKSRHARRIFVSSFLLLSLICALVLYYLEFSTSSIIGSLAIEIFSGCLIVLSFYSIYVFFIGEPRSKSGIELIRYQDISMRISSLPIGAQEYMFWGRSGSFFRADQLRKMNSESEKGKKDILIKVVLPDPNNQKLVHLYGRMMNSIGENTGTYDLLSHVIATCIAGAIYESQNRRLKLEIFISNILPTYRIDLSNNGLILTQDDKKKSAIFFDADTEFYDLFRSNVLTECEMSKKLDWDKSIFEGLDILQPCLRSCHVHTFGLEFDDETVNVLLPKIKNLIQSQSHKYK